MVPAAAPFACGSVARTAFRAIPARTERDDRTLTGASRRERHIGTYVRLPRVSPSSGSPAHLLFTARALQAGDGRGLPGSLDLDEFAVESARDLAGQIIDRVDRPVGHVVAPCLRLHGVGPNPMAAFGARLPRHAANRTRRRAPPRVLRGRRKHQWRTNEGHEEHGTGRRPELSAAVSLAAAPADQV